MLQSLGNIFHLGIKEFRSLVRDPAMLVLIAWSFSIGIYVAAHAQPETLERAPVAIVDEDRSDLSMSIVDSIYPPYFKAPTVTRPRLPLPARTLVATPSPWTFRRTFRGTFLPDAPQPFS